LKQPGGAKQTGSRSHLFLWLKVNLRIFGWRKVLPYVILHTYKKSDLSAVALEEVLLLYSRQGILIGFDM